jgi:RNA polymerase sigma-70 factor (ECF subfamily)
MAENPTSQTLLERLRGNEHDAWEAMVKLYTPLVYHWCRRGGVTGADAEDILQEVFQAAATSLGNFRRERPGDSFRGWLRGITKNMILMHFRRRGRQPVAAGGTDAFRKLNELADGTPDTDDEDPGAELDALHRRALELVKSEFEQRTWQMFWLTAIEGRSPVDIGAAMGVSPTAVRMAKSRVLHRLKEEFGDLVG